MHVMLTCCNGLQCVQSGENMDSYCSKVLVLLCNKKSKYSKNYSSALFSYVERYETVYQINI